MAEPMNLHPRSPKYWRRYRRNLRRQRRSDRIDAAMHRYRRILARLSDG